MLLLLLLMQTLRFGFLLKTMRWHILVAPWLAGWARAQDDYLEAAGDDERKMRAMLQSPIWAQIEHEYGVDGPKPRAQPLLPQAHVYSERVDVDDYDDLPPQQLAAGSSMRRSRRSRADPEDRPPGNAEPDPAQFVPESIDQLTSELDDAPKRVEPRKLSTPLPCKSISTSLMHCWLMCLH